MFEPRQAPPKKPSVARLSIQRWMQSRGGSCERCMGLHTATGEDCLFRAPCNCTARHVFFIYWGRIVSESVGIVVQHRECPQGYLGTAAVFISYIRNPHGPGLPNYNPNT